MNEKEDQVAEQEVHAEAVPEKAPFVPSAKWKRVMAWVLFAIVAVGVILWLINIADPNWVGKVLDYFRN